MNLKFQIWNFFSMNEVKKMAAVTAPGNLEKVLWWIIPDWSFKMASLGERENNQQKVKTLCLRNSLKRLIIKACPKTWVLEYCQKKIYASYSKKAKEKLWLGLGSEQLSHLYFWVLTHKARLDKYTFRKGKKFIPKQIWGANVAPKMVHFSLFF